MELFIMSAAALLSVMNPLGTVPIFVGLTSDNNNKERSTIALFTSIYVFVILFLSFYFGQYILVFFGITLNSLKIAGGLIIASSGFALLTGKFTEHKGMKKREKDDAFRRSEISLTPLAIPMLAGPGTISLLISYQQEYKLFLDQVFILLAIVVASIAIYLVLISSKFIVKSLGASGINALSRIIGFIVISIGVEYVLSTIIEIFKY